MNKYIHWFSVDAIPIRVKKKRFKKYQDSCGRDLTVIQLYWTTRNFQRSAELFSDRCFLLFETVSQQRCNACVALKMVVANRSV